MWSGLHGALGIVHPFLAGRDDLDLCYAGLGDNRENSILTGSGDLLLVKRSSPRRTTLSNDTVGDDTLRDDEDFNTFSTTESVLRSMGLLGADDDQSNSTPEVDQHKESLKLGQLQHWQTLLVVNPSTHKYRVLPPANSMDVGLEFWSYNGVHANLLVDTESQTYTVTLTFPHCVCLYSTIPTHGGVGGSTREPHEDLTAERFWRTHGKCRSPTRTSMAVSSSPTSSSRTLSLP